jgi:hypothetical protein
MLAIKAAAAWYSCAEADATTLLTALTWAGMFVGRARGLRRQRLHLPGSDGAGLPGRRLDVARGLFRPDRQSAGTTRRPAIGLADRTVTEA